MEKYTQDRPKLLQSPTASGDPGQGGFKAQFMPMTDKAMAGWLAWVMKSITGFNMATTNL